MQEGWCWVANKYWGRVNRFMVGPRKVMGPDFMREQLANSSHPLGWAKLLSMLPLQREFEAPPPDLRIVDIDRESRVITCEY